MVKRISIAAVLAGGLLAGTLGLAGGANADSGADGHSYGAPYHDAPYYDAPYYDAQVHGRRYDAPYYGAPEVLPQSGTSVTLGPNGVRLNLPGGGAISAGPGGLGGWVPAA